MADVPRRAFGCTLAGVVLVVCLLMGPGFGSAQAPQVVPPGSSPALLAEKVPPPPLPAMPTADQAAPIPVLTIAGKGQQRFQFKIDPGTPLTDLLPVPPKARRQDGPVFPEDPTQAPEVLFQEPPARHLATDRAMQQTAHAIAKINHLNQKKTDGFLEVLLERRADLSGLPFAMGDACRTKGEHSREFNLAVNTVRRVMQQTLGGPFSTTAVRFETREVVMKVMEEERVMKATRLREVARAVPPAPSLPTPPPPPDAPGPGTASASVRSSSPPAPTPGTTPLGSVPRPDSSPGPKLPTPEAQVKVIREVVQVPVQVAVPAQPPSVTPNPVDAADSFWQHYQDACAQEDRQAARRDCGHQEIVTRARVAALMQMLAPETPGLRLGLVKYLAGVSHVDATRALAKLSLFSAEDEVRRAALDALKVRRERDYTDILLAGFRYPLPAVARRAGEAVVKLERTDLEPQLVALLDEPDPRAPVMKEAHEKKVPVVRELVRINHHRSCLLCHAPGNTSSVSAEALTAPVPVPSEPLPSPSQGYGNSIPDVLVRIDVTYLRQDFSMLLPVTDASPWPEMQRFDFLVRNRELTEEEAKACEAKLQGQGPGYVAPHRRAALAALRELTGRDTEPTGEAWRRLLNLPSRRGDSRH
jgi:hypothetical protein